MRIRSAVLAAATFAFPAVALAQPFQGFYIGGGAGYHLPLDIKVVTPPGSPSANLRTSGSFIGLGSAGYGLGNGLRFELEGGVQQTGLSSVASPGVTGTVGGNLRTYTAMANVMFDMDIGVNWLYPYVGAGVGYGWSSPQNMTITSPFGRSSISGTSGGLAAQGIGGVSFPMPNMPGLSLTAEYRFFHMEGTQKFRNVTAGTTFVTDSQNSHNFLFGVRYAFGVTPPPAPATAAAVPAVVPARSYLVFFDWDKAVLTERARTIVKEAADASTKVQTTKIEVNGNADASGTHVYNQGLSMRRAQAVAAELVKDGVPKTAISIQAFGDTKPLVPTAPGVREPQNRRVEIILR